MSVERGRELLESWREKMDKELKKSLGKCMLCNEQIEPQEFNMEALMIFGRERVHKECWTDFMDALKEETGGQNEVV